MPYDVTCNNCHDKTIEDSFFIFSSMNSFTQINSKIYCCKCFRQLFSNFEFTSRFNSVLCQNCNCMCEERHIKIYLYDGILYSNNTFVCLCSNCYEKLTGERF